MKKKRRSIEIFSLSFLDVVSCGFGAIILLLVIMKVVEPQVITGISEDLTNDIITSKEEIIDLKNQIQQVRKTLNNLYAVVSMEKKTIAVFSEELKTKKDATNTLKTNIAALHAIDGQMASAQQTLTAEMQRLQKTAPPVFADSIIGGVPVDSEYIIFIIDTSGSMQQHAWPAVKTKMAEILEIYPTVKGLQVINDMGDYMFSKYAGKWIRDTPSRRKAIIKRLASWQAFSNSSPEEGVIAAIKRFYDGKKKISLYIFGDDFSRGSIQNVIDSVAKINNSQNSDGKVRIHAVGFPVLFTQSGASTNISRFSALMRRLAEDNSGSFVGLSNL